MTEDVAFSAIEWQIKNIKGSKRESGELIFFGGEPLLNFGLIRKAIEYAKKRSNEENVSIRFALTTNATLITPDIANMLKEWNLVPLISIDGNEQTQNANRPYKNGSGSYRDAIKGYKTLQETLGFPLSARMTCTNASIFENIISLYENGFRNVYYCCASGSCGKFLKSDEGIEAYLDESKKIYNFFANHFIKSANVDKMPKNNVFYHSMRMLIRREVVPWPCGAGRAYVGIAPNRNIYLCHRFIGNEKFKMGNVLKPEYNESFYKKVLDETGSRKGDCQKCWIRMSCAGGCLYLNNTDTGNPFVSSQQDCRISKSQFKMVAKLYYNLWTKYPHLIKMIAQEAIPTELLLHKKEES